MQPFAQRFQLFIFTGFQLSTLDFLNLIAQRFHPPQLFAFVHGQAADFRSRLLYRFKGRRIGGQFGFILGKQIQIPQVVCLIEQLLGIVLAVDVNQLNTQLSQQRHCNRTAIDPADIFTIQPDFSLNQQFLRLILHLIFCKPIQRADTGKHGTDKGLVTAGTNHVPVGPFAQNGADGVDDNGFTGTGLAGKHVKSRIKGNIRLFNDGNIFNMQHGKHGGSPFTPGVF